MQQIILFEHALTNVGLVLHMWFWGPTARTWHERGYDVQNLQSLPSQITKHTCVAVTMRHAAAKRPRFYAES